MSKILFAEVFLGFDYQIDHFITGILYNFKGERNVIVKVYYI